MTLQVLKGKKREEDIMLLIPPSLPLFLPLSLPPSLYFQSAPCDLNLIWLPSRFENILTMIDAGSNFGETSSIVETFNLHDEHMIEQYCLPQFLNDHPI